MYLVMRVSAHDCVSSYSLQVTSVASSATSSTVSTPVEATPLSAPSVHTNMHEFMSITQVPLY